MLLCLSSIEFLLFIAPWILYYKNSNSLCITGYLFNLKIIFIRGAFYKLWIISSFQKYTSISYSNFIQVGFNQLLISQRAMRYQILSREDMNQVERTPAFSVFCNRQHPVTIWNAYFISHVSLIFDQWLYHFSSKSNYWIYGMGTSQGNIYAPPLHICLLTIPNVLKEVMC